MSTTCQACGVAVVPGYVKCPRCGARLPSIRISKATSASDPGGTAVVGASKPPWLAIGGGVVVAVAIMVFFATRHHAPKDDDQPAPPPPTATAPRPPPPRPPAVGNSPPPTFANDPVASNGGPTREQVAADLDRALKSQRLWSTVSVVGTRLEIRSSTCGDPQMRPAIESAVPRMQAVGLTGLRCVEESGAVAFTRDL